VNSSSFVVTVCWYRTMSSAQDGCSARESEERCKVSVLLKLSGTPHVSVVLNV